MTDHHRNLDIVRKASAAMLAAGVLLGSGCTSVPNNTHRSFAPLGGIASKLGGGDKDNALRKKVSADKFPTAQEAGI